MSNKVDPTVLSIIIGAILTMILRLRIKINKNGQEGIYQFLLDFQKQIKEDPDLLDNVLMQLNKSKQKTTNKNLKNE